MVGRRSQHCIGNITSDRSPLAVERAESTLKTGVCRSPRRAGWAVFVYCLRIQTCSVQCRLKCSEKFGCWSRRFTRDTPLRKMRAVLELELPVFVLFPANRRLMSPVRREYRHPEADAASVRHCPCGSVPQFGAEEVVRSGAEELRNHHAGAGGQQVGGDGVEVFAVQLVADVFDATR